MRKVQDVLVTFSGFAKYKVMGPCAGPVLSDQGERLSTTPPFDSYPGGTSRRFRFFQPPRRGFGVQTSRASLYTPSNGVLRITCDGTTTDVPSGFPGEAVPVQQKATSRYIALIPVGGGDLAYAMIFDIDTNTAYNNVVAGMKDYDFLGDDVVAAIHNRIVYYDIASNTEGATIATLTNPIDQLAVAGTVIAARSNGNVHFVDTVTLSVSDEPVGAGSIQVVVSTGVDFAVADSTHGAYVQPGDTITDVPIDSYPMRGETLVQGHHGAAFEYTSISADGVHDKLLVLGSPEIIQPASRDQINQPNQNGDNVVGMRNPSLAHFVDKNWEVKQTLILPSMGGNDTRRQLSPDGRYMARYLHSAIPSAPSSVSVVYDLETQVNVSPPAVNRVSYVQFSEDSSYLMLVIGSSIDITLSIFSLTGSTATEVYNIVRPRVEAYETTITFNLQRNIGSAAIFGNRYLAVVPTDLSNAVEIHDFIAGSVVNTIPLPAQILDRPVLRWASVGSILVGFKIPISNNVDHEVVIVNTNTMQAVAALPIKAAIVVGIFGGKLLLAHSPISIYWVDISNYSYGEVDTSVVKRYTNAEHDIPHYSATPLGIDDTGKFYYRCYDFSSSSIATDLNILAEMRVNDTATAVTSCLSMRFSGDANEYQPVQSLEIVADKYEFVGAIGSPVTLATSEGDRVRGIGTSAFVMRDANQPIPKWALAVPDYPGLPAIHKEFE